MKRKKCLALLLTFAMLLSGIACTVPTVHADNSYEVYKLIGLDQVEAVTIPLNTTITSQGIPQVTVTQRKEIQIDGEQVGDATVTTVSGVLYKLLVPANTDTTITFTTENQSVRVYSFYSLNPAIKGGSISSDKISGGRIYYYWVEGDDGTLSITTTSTKKPVTVDEATEKKIAEMAAGLDADKVYVYMPNTEVANLMEYFYEKYPQYKDKVVCLNLNMGGLTDEYVTYIKRLAWDSKNSTAIVAMDAYIVDDMLATQQFASLKSLGLEDAYGNAYDYTKKKGSYQGTQYLTACEAYPGNFIYDSEIAKTVLGTSDPVKVQEMMNTPEKFLQVAAKMKAAGYYMTTGVDSLYQVNPDTGEAEIRVDEAGDICDYGTNFAGVDSRVCKELAQALVLNGYATKHTSWSNDWVADLKDTRGRKVFGVFGCSWFATGTLPSYSQSALYQYGQCCPGPFPYVWGGTYLGVTNQNKNQELAALVIETLCCDEAVMAKISKEKKTFVNNKNVNLTLAADDKAYSKQYPNSYSGQNLYDLWNQVALAIGNKTSISLEEPLKKGSSVTVGSVTYKINDLSKRTVTYVKTKKKTKTVTIPDTVTIRGLEYKVTEIAANAFKGNKTMTKLTVGKNVETIGKSAFQNCTKLKTATIKSAALKTIGKSAFQGCTKLQTATVSSKVLTKLGDSAFQNCTTLQSVTISSTVLKTIGASAFSGDKKLTKLTLKTTKLTKNSVGKNALKGTSEKLVIKVPSKKVSAYKKYFKDKGNKKVKVKK